MGLWGLWNFPKAGIASIHTDRLCWGFPSTLTLRRADSPSPSCGTGWLWLGCFVSLLFSWVSESHEVLISCLLPVFSIVTHPKCSHIFVTLVHLCGERFERWAPLFFHLGSPPKEAGLFQSLISCLRKVVHVTLLHLTTSCTIDSNDMFMKFMLYVHQNSDNMHFCWHGDVKIDQNKAYVRVWSLCLYVWRC
jgi:hypothetical protein